MGLHTESTVTESTAWHFKALHVLGLVTCWDMVTADEVIGLVQRKAAPTLRLLAECGCPHFSNLPVQVWLDLLQSEDSVDWHMVESLARVSVPVEVSDKLSDYVSTERVFHLLGRGVNPVPALTWLKYKWRAVLSEMVTSRPYVPELEPLLPIVEHFMGLAKDTFGKQLSVWYNNAAKGTACDMSVTFTANDARKLTGDSQLTKVCKDIASAAKQGVSHCFVRGNTSAFVQETLRDRGFVVVEEVTGNQKCIKVSW